jgi:hypothetical protein
MDNELKELLATLAKAVADLQETAAELLCFAEVHLMPDAVASSRTRQQELRDKAKQLRKVLEAIS